MCYWRTICQDEMLMEDYMPRRNVDGKTSMYALAGQHINFSPIPMFFNAISNYIGYNSIMLPIDTQKNGIVKCLEAIKIINCAGGVIHSPHRCELNDFLTSVSEEALKCNAVNVVKIDETGFHGHNTEVSAFRKVFPVITGDDLYGKKIFIFGSGGISHSIAVACAEEQCASITIVNRTHEKSQMLCDLINSNYGDIAFSASFEDSTTIHNFYNADVLIQATTVGMFPQIEENLIYNGYNLMPHHTVLEAIYNPPQTKFMRIAEEKGCKVFSLRDMMFFNCIQVFQWLTGVYIDKKNEKNLFNIWHDLIYNM